MKIRFIIIALSLMSLNAHAQKYHYDVNNDGHVTVSDIMLIVNKILGKADDEPEYPLTVSVSQEPINDANGAASSKKRTKETFLDDLTEFYMNYTFTALGDLQTGTLNTFRVNDDYTGKSRWLVGNDDDSGEGGWPTYAANPQHDLLTNFYAYANVDIDKTKFSCEGNDILKPNLHFYLEESSTDTKDLLIAKNSDKYSNCKGNLYFHFTHACSAVKFFLSKTERLEKNTIKVQKAYLCNVKNDGYYYFESGSWENVKFRNPDNRMMYTLWDGGSFTEVSPVTSENPYPWQLSTATDKENDYFFFIPQTFGPEVPQEFYPFSENTTFPYIKLVLTISGKTKDGAERSYGSELEPGVVYIPFTIGELTQGIASNAIISIGTSLRKPNGDRIFDTDGYMF